MNETRQMVYHFLELPHHVQVRLANELGLSEAQEDANIFAFTRWFAEARERGLVEKFRELVGRVYEKLSEFRGETNTKQVALSQNDVTERAIVEEVAALAKAGLWPGKRAIATKAIELADQY